MESGEWRVVRRAGRERVGENRRVVAENVGGEQRRKVEEESRQGEQMRRAGKERQQEGTEEWWRLEESGEKGGVESGSFLNSSSLKKENAS